MRKLLGLVGLGAALKYFFDPQQGRATPCARRVAFFRQRARKS